ncbi:hypothetical protein EC973_002301 [Apophysomyces ossiformis]|uniref:Transcription factor domain-containing protein n=1 Tax=Apophysomyces ossiformis TaxID=679940 RepID=A0A8H7BNV2_9FUNG|nr:hypothetical protein EC973_002301 [Apophysomyces ossiformis]
MYLPCLFKFTAKPKLSKKPLTVSKRNRVLEDIWNLELQVTAMEDMLESYDIAINLQPPKKKKLTSQEVQYQQEHQSSSTSTPPANSWSLVLSRKKDGLRLDTSVRTVSDIVYFLNNTIRQLLAEEVPHTALYHTDRSNAYMDVLIPILPIELMLRKMFRNAIVARQYLRDEDFGGNEVILYLKEQFIDTYFGCQLFAYPVLVRDFFKPYIKRNMNSMLANALAAAVAYSQCQHIDISNFGFSRKVFGSYVRRQARAEFESVLFDEPTLDTLMTLWFLLECTFLTLDSKQARTLTSLGWRMAILLKDTYIPILASPNEYTMEEQILAEAWRRIFYRLRYCEICMDIIYNGHVDFTVVLHAHSGVGYPEALPCERADKDIYPAVQFFRFGVQLMLLPEHPSDVGQEAKITRHRLDLGVLEETPMSHMEQMEIEMSKLWLSLPPSYRLSDGLVEYIRPERILTAPLQSMRMNYSFYLTWMNIEIRIMETPAKTDLCGASLGRLDGDRALIIVSVCVDALTQICNALYYRWPCTLELHWLVVTIDVITRLTECANEAIRKRAVNNLEVATALLHRCRHQFAGWSYSACTSPASSQTSLTSDHSSGTNDTDLTLESRPPLETDEAILFDVLHENAERYFKSQNILFY